MEWMPIETAPRDGTHILAISGKYGVRETYYRAYGEGSPARAAHVADPSKPSGSWSWEEPMHNWAASWTPAYWMPLPPPPTDRRTPEVE